jgi:hypothetical protein
MYRPILSILIVIIFHEILFSQEKCECCTYNSIDKVELYADFFAPNLISSANIRQATIYTTEKINDTKKRYLQTKFEFNKQGYVIKRKWYIMGGKPQSMYSYDRNEKNEITTVTFSYLDRNEKKIDFMSPEVTDYHYSNNGKLIKTKQRGNNGEVLADSMTNYESFKYDVNGKMIKNIRHLYWEGFESGSKHVYNKTHLEYVNEYERSSKIYIDDELFLTSTTKFNNQGNKTFQEDFNVKMNSLASSTIYNYDEKNNLSFIKVRSGEGAGTECEDGGNFQETYFYDERGLVKIIIHEFENVECKMEVEFK